MERVSEAGDRRLEVVEAEVGKELYKRQRPDRSRRHFLPGLDSLQWQLTTVVSSRINHNEGAENAGIVAFRNMRVLPSHF